jgi:trehalose-phosphatase
MRKFKSGQWTRVADEQLPWKKSVREILEYYVERTPGTFVEERNCSFIWHYEKSEDSTLAARQAGECCNHVNDSCESYRVHAVPLGGTVLVESRDWTKATAAKTVLELTAEGGSAVDFLMVVGDGRDDEPVFSWANDLATDGEVKSVTTVKVGTKNTQANATITGVAGGLLFFFPSTLSLFCLATILSSIGDCCMRM